MATPVASDATFIRAASLHLQRPLHLPAGLGHEAEDAIPKAVLAATLSALSHALAQARKPKLAHSAAAAVVEQVGTCREERVQARKQREARVRGRGKVRVDAEDWECGRGWWEGLPEEWAADHQDDEEEQLLERYDTALRNVKTKHARKTVLAQQLAHYRKLNSLLNKVDAAQLSSALVTEDSAPHLQASLERCVSSAGAAGARVPKRPRPDAADEGAAAVLSKVLNSASV